MNDILNGQPGTPARARRPVGRHHASHLRGGGRIQTCPGLNWSAAGQADPNAGCEPPPPQPEKKVWICHAMNFLKDPYDSIEPNVNGILNGHATTPG